MKQNNSQIQQIQQIQQLQQGDVLLKPVQSVPSTATVRQRGGKIILAQGEATGHHHAIEDSDAELILDGERMLLRLEKQATLTHQEHGPIEVPPGCYEIGQVQEWDYLKQIARKVID